MKQKHNLRMKARKEKMCYKRIVPKRNALFVESALKRTGRSVANMMVGLVACADSDNIHWFVCECCQNCI